MLLNLNDDIHCSFYTKILLSTIYIQQGKIVKVEQNFQNVQQTIYSVRTYSCWICCLNISLHFKTSSFKSYDSHQLPCGGMVEGNSELFCIAWFCRHLYIHPGLFGGLKIVQFDWLLLKLINYSYGYKPIGVPHFGQLDVSWYPMKI